MMAPGLEEEEGATEVAGSAAEDSAAVGWAALVMEAEAREEEGLGVVG